MANLPVIFLLQFLVLVTAQAQTTQSNCTTISFGCSLFPTRHPTSWQSPSGLFAFGFYQQGSGFMIGIWLTGNPNSTVVWTAHRGDAPVTSNSKIDFTKKGKLVLSTNQGLKEQPIIDLPEPATSASMLDSGNFVVRNGDRVIWKSFAHPTDTILAGQALSGGQRLESSASTLDHSSGRFYLKMQSDGNLVAYATNSSDGSEKSSDGSDDAYWATGTFGNSRVSLNLSSTGILSLRQSSRPTSPLKVLNNISKTENNKDNIIYRVTLDSDGIFRLYSHRFVTPNNSTMFMEWWALQNQCDAKGYCGHNSFCDNRTAVAECVCFPGFDLVVPENKFLGCYRTFLDDQGCKVEDSTLWSYNIKSLQNTEWDGYPYSAELQSKQEPCAQSCLEDCNCWAALHVNITCKKYKLPLKYGVMGKSSIMAFIKTSFPKKSSHGSNNQIVVVETKKTLILGLALSLGFLGFMCSVIAVFSLFFYRSQASKYRKLSMNTSPGLTGDYNHTLRSFTYDQLEKAADGFKDEIGRNLFGSLYKGVISGGQIVTVKRLEKIAEGERGFRAEMTAIGQTHHKNLVRLLGFCIEGARKLLVYEFFNNGSLADLLFNDGRRPKWNERVRFALDLARGIFYLHEECEVRIVHCNINPQNILMDDSWTAKISDFGTAKLLMPNQSGTFTGVRGTGGGYLAPEWHKNGPISEKVDVYSYGIVLFEIICCRSNMEVDVSTADEVILSTWVYDCFVAKQLTRLSGDEGGVDMRTFERMVKVGLLCIQDDPNLRPTMKSVILMIEGTMDVPVPPSPTPSLVAI